MIFKCSDFNDGFFKLNKYLFDTQDYDFERGGVTAHKFDVTMRSESPRCTLNLHDLNYTINKWKMLNNLYIDTEELGVFLGRLLHYKGQRKHQKYIPDIAMQFKSRRNVSGACLLNISLGFHNEKWYCFVTSRASELTCRWPIDLIFINVLLRTIGDYLEIDYEKIEVNWHMISTYQSITSIPYFLVMAGMEDWFNENTLEDLTPKSWQWYTLKRYDKCYRDINQYSNYRVQRRPVEAYKMLKGEMPRKHIVNTEDLFIGIVPFKGLLEEDYDEVDVLHMNKEILTDLIAKAKEDDLFGKGGYR